MPRVCTICRHAKRVAIDKALLEGEPYRHIASRTGTSTGALQRHRPHLPATMAKAHDAREVAYGDGLLDQARELQRRAMRLLDSAEAAGAIPAATMALREARGCLEMLGRLMGEINGGATVNVLNVSPEALASVREALADRLSRSQPGPHPGVLSEAAITDSARESVSSETRLAEAARLSRVAP